MARLRDGVNAREPGKDEGTVEKDRLLLFATFIADGALATKGRGCPIAKGWDVAPLGLFLNRSFGSLLALAAALPLAGCVGGPGPRRAAEAPRVEQPAPVQAEAPPAGPTIGTGKVRVGLILPLSGAGQAATAATSLRNAAELAATEIQNADLAILVKDDRGTPEGAREAAAQAIAEGAELIIGPLFAGSVQAAGAVARPAAKPVIAFSTDPGVAAPGVYLLSFLAQAEVDRVVDHAAARGRRSFAALIPETTYGSVVEGQFREAAARRGVRVVTIERYAPGQPQPAIARLAPLVAGPTPQADALFIPETADGLVAVGDALAQAGFNPQRTKPLGTGVWNDPRVFRIAALQGGWFAAPDSAGFAAFADRYRARYGAEPARLATLAYDAVALAAALNRQHGSQRYSEGVLTGATGFTGADGVFRFKPDGTNDRALAVLEVREGATAAASPAPRVLASGM